MGSKTTRTVGKRLNAGCKHPSRASEINKNISGCNQPPIINDRKNLIADLEAYLADLKREEIEKIPIKLIRTPMVHLPLDIIINGKANMLIDTGAEVSLIKREKLNPKIVINTGNKINITGVCGTSHTLGSCPGKILVGKGIPCEFFVIENNDGLPGDGLIGNDILSQYTNIEGPSQQLVFPGDGLRIPIIPNKQSFHRTELSQIEDQRRIDIQKMEVRPKKAKDSIEIRNSENSLNYLEYLPTLDTTHPKWMDSTSRGVMDNNLTSQTVNLIPTNPILGQFKIS